MALVALAVVATLWLAISGQLLLYIHPRYLVFTVAMALVAAVLLLASVLRRHHHDDELVEVPAGRRARLASIAGLVLAAALGVGMVALPPATLTSATAGQRDMNAAALDLGQQDAAALAGATTVASESFDIADWASLLRQTSDPGFYADKPLLVSGFIVPDPDDPENVFYVSRFLVTCCAVDAQPLGVPVHQPGWASAYAADDWVEVAGIFTLNPSRSSTQALAVSPASITPIDQPSDPYLF